MGCSSSARRQETPASGSSAPDYMTLRDATGTVHYADCRSDTAQKCLSVIERVFLASSEPPTTTATLALREGVVGAALHVIRRWPDDAELAAASCRALARVCAGRSDALTSDDIVALVATMTQFPSHKTLQFWCVSVFSSVACNDDARTCVVRAGGVRAILDAMDKNLYDSCLHRRGCNALQWLCHGERCNEAVAQVCETLDVFDDDELVQYEGLAALCVIAIDAGTENEDRLAAYISEAVESAMRSFAANLSIQLAACKAVANLALCSARVRGFLIAADCVKLVKAAMQRHGAAGMLEQGLRALAALALHSQLQTCDAAVLADVVPLAVQAMRLNPASTAMQQHALAVLVAGTADPSVAAVIAASHTDVIPLAVSAMSLHNAAEIVQLDGCSLLRTLVTCDAAIARVLHSYGGISVVAAAARSRFWDVRFEACCALRIISGHGVVAALDANVVASVVASILVAVADDYDDACMLQTRRGMFEPAATRDDLRAYRLNAQYLGCRALECIMFKAKDDAKQPIAAILHDSGVASLLTILKRRDVDVNVAGAACAALARGVKRCGAVVVAALTADDAALVFSTARQFISNRYLQIATAVFMHGLCMHRCALVHGSAAVQSYVVASMRAHVADSALQKEWMDVLRRLLPSCRPQTTDHFVQAGGVSVVLAVQRLHRENDKVQAFGLAVLLCCVHAGYVHAVSADISVVVDAMARLPDDLDVQRFSLEILHLCCVDAETGSAVIRAGGVDAVTRAQTLFSTASKSSDKYRNEARAMIALQLRQRLARESI